nr:hypothetical protein [Tanacetum cinerariifolium]
HCAEKTKFQTKMESVLQENDRLLTQALTVEIVNIVVNDHVKFYCLNVDACAHCVTTESELKSDLIKKECYETLLQQYNILETYCISLETYKQLYDSIKSSRVQSKEQCDDLINKVNLKSAEVSDLNTSLQEKVLVITALKEQLNKLKGKVVLTEAISLNPFDPALLQVDVAPLVPKLLKNRTAHTDYIRHTQEEAATLREIVERVTLVASASGSKSQDNTTKNKIRQTQKKAKKTELEDHLRTVKSSLNKEQDVGQSKRIFIRPE